MIFGFIAGVILTLLSVATYLSFTSRESGKSLPQRRISVIMIDDPSVFCGLAKGTAIACTVVDNNGDCKVYIKDEGSGSAINSSQCATIWSLN